MTTADREHVAAWFTRFALNEGAESERYADWATWIAADEDMCDRIAELPRAKRQPILVLTAIRFAGVPLRHSSLIQDDVVALWPQIVDIITAHSTQTNDPRRSSLVLAGLQHVHGPIALIEVGASAGFGLMLDRYVYRWSMPGRAWRHTPDSGDTSVVLSCEVSGWGANPPRIPEIVWREGIDLSPLDVTNSADRDWLEALVWPEQTDRLDIIRGAADVVVRERPSLVHGDALADLPAAVERARAAAPDATIVVSSPAVLVYLDPQARLEFAERCAELGVVWISVDGRDVFPDLAEAARAVRLSGDYFLTVDGQPVASVDPLGRSMTVVNSWGLTPRQMDLLEFERVHWGTTPRKESLVRSVWNLALVRYYQTVYAIMESDAARRYDPVLTRHFDDVRAQRGQRRIGGRTPSL